MSQGQAGSETVLTPRGPRPLIVLPGVYVGNDGYVPVNADDDNGSALTNGIPAKRDFDIQPLRQLDPDLIPVTVTYDTGVITAVTLVVNSDTNEAAPQTDETCKIALREGERLRSCL
jgi:hypothetical protein